MSNEDQLWDMAMRDMRKHGPLCILASTLDCVRGPSKFKEIARDKTRLCESDPNTILIKEWRTEQFAPLAISQDGSRRRVAPDPDP